MKLNLFKVESEVLRASAIQSYILNVKFSFNMTVLDLLKEKSLPNR